MAKLIDSFEGARLKAFEFCYLRQWEKFHLPTSLALALSGEAGEVCEIFQWKGTLEQELQEKKENIFTEKELVHIGEEIADVFIYTTRLCDVCKINLSKAILTKLSSSETSDCFVDSSITASSWEKLSFEELSPYVTKTLPAFRSQRHISLELQKHVGSLTSSFTKYSETLTNNALSGWQLADKHAIASHAASIMLTLFLLAKLTNLTISQCITDKFAKNDAKYPVNLSKGSSAKYTAYMKSNNFTMSHLIGVALLGAVIGHFVRF